MQLKLPSSEVCCWHDRRTQLVLCLWNICVFVLFVFGFFVITSAYSNLQRDCRTSETFSHPFPFLIYSECLTKGEISVWTGLPRAIATRQKVKTGHLNRLARQKQYLLQWSASVGWWKLCLWTTYFQVTHNLLVCLTAWNAPFKEFIQQEAG